METDSTVGARWGRKQNVERKNERISLSGGLGLALTCIGAGLKFAVPEMIVPPVWGLALIVAGIGILICTAVAAIWNLVQDDRPRAIRQMPLHETMRYVAADSMWARSRSARAAKNWITAADAELQAKLATGQLESWGYYKADHQLSETGQSSIPKDFWRTAEWHSHCIVTDEPPSHAWNRAGVYRRVMVDSDAVLRLWPRRSFPSRMFGVLRRKYRDVWTAQDAAYRKMCEHPPYSLFSGMIGDGDASSPYREH